MVKGLQVRPFRIEDTDAVLELWQAAGLSQWDARPRTSIQKKLGHSPGAFLAGVMDGRVVATVMVGYDGLRGWLYRLAVAPDYQRRGIGRAMVEQAESWLREQGCLKVKLQVEERVAESVEFYRRLGYDVQQLVSMGKWLAPPEREPGQD